MSAALATYISIICLALSALAWIIAAFVAPVIKASYFDHLPRHLINRQKIAGFANAVAAMLAAFGVALQAYANYLSTLPAA
ncbi:hypothetical protein ELH48_09230 [Rhizobium ruizarguesonis]|uniref:hypothetical protein n=1 Tax=Rhizobium ruizarguesonis TaxID=2081791 RepID=UPI001030E48B|nr:hypothetical protein [Rhizobium ruizarguesonis]TBB27319.1 hypothetical protein ELH48_09230 [Rhizobium ruizarguesonis]